jgi:hypothetical protein
MPDVVMYQRFKLLVRAALYTSRQFKDLVIPLVYLCYTCIN